MSALVIGSAPDRTETIFHDQLAIQRARTTRIFAWLMLAQWIGAIVAALVISPQTWIGEQHRVHQHVWVAILFGGVLASLPIALALTFPGRVFTRHVIAVAQMLFSSLLIHLSGGRIETHFHVFGSLAFLAFYRDWRVLATATVVVALDHMLRGLFLPLSVFGTSIASPWRWVEHAGWVVFEDIVLVLSCHRGLAELRDIAEQQARLEHAKAATENEVRVRTSELREANARLLDAAAEREALHNQLLTASREAGRAEVAIGVLHNVGNVLNSVNVAATLVSQALRASEVPNLVQAGGMLREHAADLPAFLREDERGRHLPAFLIEVAECLGKEHEGMLRELDTVTQGVAHVKQVISLQQSHAKRKTLADEVNPADLVEAALQMQQDSPTAHAVTVVRRIEATDPVHLDKHQVLQILVNLVSNAKQATRHCKPGEARIGIAAMEQRDDTGRRVRFEVTDNGVGIPKENLGRIFSHGFTTRADGHGFGLHTAATAAQAMGGSLKAESNGPGHGARFVLVLPVASPVAIGAGEGHPHRLSGTTKERSCTGS